MNISETVLRWEASLCHTNQEPQVYHLDHEIEENVTGLLSDGLPQTCQPLFPPGTSFANNVMFIHRIPPIRLPRLNVIGRYTDCSPISGLLVYAMDDSGVLRPCTSYIGVNVGDFTTCRFLCDIDGLVSYIVIGISGRRALTMSETAAICEIAVVWGPPSLLETIKSLPFMVKYSSMDFLPDTYNCGLRMRRECRESFPRHRRLAIPTCITARAVTHVPWCMPGSLTRGFLWSRWRGKYSRHSRRMHNPQFHVSGKGPLHHVHFFPQHSQ